MTTMAPSDFDMEAASIIKIPDGESHWYAGEVIRDKNKGPRREKRFLFCLATIALVGAAATIGVHHAPKGRNNDLALELLDPFKNGEMSQNETTTNDRSEAESFLRFQESLNNLLLQDKETEDKAIEEKAKELEDEEEESIKERFNREMAAVTRPEMFSPLTCNQYLWLTCCASTLSGLVSSMDPNFPLIIPCGECYHVDYTNGTELTFPKGIIVEGKLVFPSTSNVTIRTTHLWVLGVLETEVPSFGNLVKISFINSQTGAPPLLPHVDQPNQAACANGCDVGKKGLVVAGGQLNITGFDPACPSWEKLADAFPPPSDTVETKDFCKGNVILNGKGDDPNGAVSPWEIIGHGQGVDLSCPGEGGEDCAIRAYNRADWDRGLSQTLNQDCFVAGGGGTWTLEADVRLLDKNTLEGIDCDPRIGNIFCPMLGFVTWDTTRNSVSHGMNLYAPDMIWDKDGWSTMSIDVVIPVQWEGADASTNLWLRGGPPNTILLADNVRFFLKTPAPEDPPEYLVVTPWPSTAPCWPVGSQILITTNTVRDQDRQVVTVKSTNPATGTIQLTGPITPVSTLANDPDQAVEVALLNRPIVFEAEDDVNNELIGGHLMIFQTPDVHQHLEGVEIRNFGQQGYLGRYPVHFHLCEGTNHSLVKKNVVRESNQRCYVIHGSSQIVFEDNIAFDTFGHCYMLEDGSEMENEFLNNLGAGIKKASVLVNSGRAESDDRASVFWITNANNTFVGNVAGGSAHNGYWIETSRTIRGPSSYQFPSLDPHIIPLKVFANNTAHGCAVFGWTPYQPGWSPETVSVIENIKVYRCAGVGMFMHNIFKMHFIGGFIGNNHGPGVDIFGAEDLVFEGTRFVGRSPNESISPFCDFLGWPYFAIVLDPQTLDAPFFDNTGVPRGTSLIDVNFTHLSPADTTCEVSAPVMVGWKQVNTYIWSAPTVFQNVTTDAPSNLFLDACGVKNAIGIDDVAVEVSNDGNIMSGFFPVTRPGSSGFLVSPALTALAGSSCFEIPNSCLHYCEGACLRTIRILNNLVGPAYKMVVTKQGTTKTLGIHREIRQGVGPSWIFVAQYSVSLPAGSFDIHFEDDEGNMAYPGFVSPVFENPPVGCMGYADKTSINIIRPPASRASCDELILNGNFETNIDGWRYLSSSHRWDRTAGVNGGSALVTENQFGFSLLQWLDVSCLEAGDIYDFTFTYRALSMSTGADMPSCDYRCMNIRIQFMTWDSDLQDKVFATGLGHSLARPAGTYQSDGTFNQFSYTWTVSEEEVAAADYAEISAFHVNGDANFIIDSVSLKRRA